MLPLRGLVLNQEGLCRKEVACLATLSQPVVAHNQAASGQAAEKLDGTPHLERERERERYEMPYYMHLEL